MIFSYQWLQSFFKEKLPEPEKLAALLSVHSFEVEEVKKQGSDFALNVNVRPNRASDCFSHWGIAREVAAITNFKIQVPSAKLKELRNIKAEDFVKVTVREPAACPRYSARVLTDVKVGPSPAYLRQRLEICGLQPINNVVDAANYVMLETGQPLHAFDQNKLKKNKIIVRFARKGEKITTLDGQRFPLDEKVLVIADGQDSVAIAGIKGGIKPGIDKNTKTVVLESANFNSRTIRRGSKYLGLKTDASWRFEHGLDLNLTERAINRCAGLIQEVAGAKIASGLIDFSLPKPAPKKIKLNLNYLESLLGIKIPLKQVIKILKSLEFQVSSSGSQELIVQVPAFRLDVSIPEDLIEEVGRLYGYEKIPFLLPQAIIALPERNEDVFWEEFSKDVLKEAGFSEVYNYSFISEETRKLFGFKKQEMVEVENPLSSDYQYLSPSLICNLLKNVFLNLKYFSEFKIFESAKIFRNAGRPIEQKALTGLIARVRDDEKAFYELKGIASALLEQMGISDYHFDDYQPTPETSRTMIWDLTKSAEIKVGGQEIGFLGEISPSLLKILKIKGQVVLFDFNFEALQRIASQEREYLPFSPYPSAVRDLAILVPQKVLVDEVLPIIELAGGELLKDVDLFDIYEGGELPEGSKNLAFHLVYQAEDRTLKAEEVDKIHQEIIKALEKNLGWEARR